MELKLDAHVQSIQFTKDTKVTLIILGGGQETLARFRNSFVRVTLESLQADLPEPKDTGVTAQLSTVDRDTGEIVHGPIMSSGELSRLVDGR